MMDATGTWLHEVGEAALLLSPLPAMITCQIMMVMHVLWHGTTSRHLYTATPQISIANTGKWPRWTACLQVHAAKGARALYCVLCSVMEPWVAASQGPLQKCSARAVLSRRSRTGHICKRMHIMQSYLSQVQVRQACSIDVGRTVLSWAELCTGTCTAQ